jgi:hypothetical protein
MTIGAEAASVVAARSTWRDGPALRWPAQLVKPSPLPVT